MNIIYYVTNHGYGHGVRTAAIVNKFPDDVHVVFRTMLPETFFREEVKRDFTYAPAAFDCGCLQTDAVSSDIGLTLATYRELAICNEARLGQEAAWCRAQDPAIIVSDIVPFAFEVAAACAVPSIAATNFTWYDIYEPYCAKLPEFHPLLARLKQQYASASLLLSLEPALPMSYFPLRKSIGPVGRRGTNRRCDIARHYGFDAAKHTGLLYVGQLGIEGFEWQALGQFTDWEFLGISPVDSPPANYHATQKSEFPYQDLAASVDCMVGKLGYSAVAEAMLHGTPMIYLPRSDFAEFAALEEAVRRWGGGECLTASAFAGCDWQDALDRVVARPRPFQVAGAGAADAASCIMRLARA